MSFTDQTIREVMESARETAAQIRAAGDTLKARHPEGGLALAGVLASAEARAIDWDMFAQRLETRL